MINYSPRLNVAFLVKIQPAFFYNVVSYLGIFTYKIGLEFAEHKISGNETELVEGLIIVVYVIFHCRTCPGPRFYLL